MFTLFVIFVFVWLFVKSVGLAFHVTWGLAKIAATLLFVIALPLLVVFAILGSLLPLLLPLALVAAAFGIPEKLRLIAQGLCRIHPTQRRTVSPAPGVPRGVFVTVFPAYLRKRTGRTLEAPPIRTAPPNFPTSRPRRIDNPRRSWYNTICAICFAQQLAE